MSGMSKYANPEAARAVNAALNVHKERLDALNLTTRQLTEIAAMFAWSYIGNGYDGAHDYYQRLIGGTHETAGDDEIRSEALDALTWQAQCGRRGSVEQIQASEWLAWSAEYKRHVV